MQDSTCLGRECVQSEGTGPFPHCPQVSTMAAADFLTPVPASLRPLLGLSALEAVKAA